MTGISDILEQPLEDRVVEDIEYNINVERDKTLDDHEIHV